MCKHGINNESFCTFCNPVKNTKAANNTEEEIILDKNAENFGEVWTQDDIFNLYVIFENITRVGKEFKKAVNECAKMLGRTRKSVIWHYRHVFEIHEDDPRGRAGKTIMEFKKIMGIGQVTGDKNGTSQVYS